MDFNWRGDNAQELYLGNFPIGAVADWQVGSNDPIQYRPWIQNGATSFDLGLRQDLETAKAALLTAAERTKDGRNIDDLVDGPVWHDLVERHRPEKSDISMHGGIRDAVDQRVSFVSMFYSREGSPWMLIDRGGRFLLEDIRRKISTPYDIVRPADFRKLDAFDDEAIAMLYPYALVLACLDGNAFINFEKPEHDLVRQYVPDAFQALRSNGHATMDELGVVTVSINAKRS